MSIENRGFEERSVLAPVGVRPRGFDGHTALPPYGSPHEDVTLHVGLRSPLSAYPVFLKCKLRLLPEMAMRFLQSSIIVRSAKPPAATQKVRNATALGILDLVGP